MNKEETIEFIMKYKDCIYYEDLTDNRQSPDIDRLINLIGKIGNISSEIVYIKDKPIYYRIFASAFLGVTEYLIDKEKKNIIDRKSKIQSIIK